MAEIEIIERIGEGATAVVYRARVPGFEGEVALKCFKDERLSDPLFLRRLEREVAGLRGLDHPQLLKIHGLVTYQSKPALVSEWINGETLDSLRVRLPFLLPEVALSLVCGVLDALSALHECGYVHRDLKPANIFIERTGRIVLGDFGLLKIPMPDSATLTGLMIGSPHYMSPEQSRGMATDALSDIYSVCTILYELVTGAPPHRGENLIQVLRALNEELPEAPERLNPKMSRTLSALLLRGLAKNPSDRPANAQTLRKRFDEYLTSIGLESGPAVFEAWLRNPSATLWDSLLSMSRSLEVGISNAIRSGDGSEAWKLVSHLGQVAPQSSQLATYVNALEALGKEKRKRKIYRWTVASALGLGLFIFALGHLQNAPNSAPVSAIAQQGLGPNVPMPVAATSVLAPQKNKPPSPKNLSKDPSPKFPVIIDVPQDVTVLWNGKRVRDLKNFPHQRAGHHKLSLVRLGKPTLEQSIEVKAGEDTVIRVR